MVFHHLYGQVFAQGSHLVWLGPLPVAPLTILSNSYQGVTLFFILSGFVLTLPYAEKRRNMVSVADALEFLRRRAARLLPLYYLALLIGFIFIAPVDDFFLFVEKAFFFFTGTFTFTQDHFFPEINFVLWSLSLELLFCLVFPLILFAMQKYGAGRVVVLFCFVALVARFVGVFLIEIHVVPLFTGTTNPILNSIFCRIDDFVLGMGLALLYVHKPKLWSPWFYSIGFLFLFIGFSVRDLSEAVLPLAVQPLSNTFINLGFFSLLAVMLLNPHPLWRWTIENPVLQLIGLMSYSIFVWHGMPIFTLEPKVDALHLLRYFMLVFALSFLTYRYIEFSSPKKLRDLLPAKRPPS